MQAVRRGCNLLLLLVMLQLMRLTADSQQSAVGITPVIAFCALSFRLHIEIHDVSVCKPVESGSY